MAEKYVSHQCGKFASSKIVDGEKKSKVLAIEAFLTTMGGKNVAELSNLCRFVLKANDTTGAESKNLTANLPVKDFLAMAQKSKIALENYMTTKDKKFSILEGQAKPKESDKTDDGTLMYSCTITYDGSRTYPISITIKNFRAEVYKLEDGTMRYKNPSKDQPYITFAVSMDDYIGTIEYMNKLVDTWLTSACINKEFAGIL